MGLSSNSLKNSREGAEASFSTAEAGGVRIVRSGPDAVAELTSELPELPPPFADTIAKPHTFPPPQRYNDSCFSGIDHACSSRP